MTSSSLTAGCSGSAAAASVSTSAKFVMGGSPLSSVASEQVVGADPLLGHDRRSERQLPAQDRRGDDLGQLAHLAGAVAAEHLQALALGCHAGDAAITRDDLHWVHYLVIVD